MKKMIMGMAILMSTGFVYAQTSAGVYTLKNFGEVRLTPEGQKKVDEAKKMATPVQQENFLVAQAKTFLTQQNFDSALGLAQYVLTNVNSKSLTAKKVMDDAKALMQKKVQEHLTGLQQQAGGMVQSSPAGQTQAQTGAVQADATKTVSDVKALFGSFGSKK
ncbi:MAG: hypothetical protein HQL17_04220 [Candidatus Omnitrophica bacterium]|nr:hypothetical protein [Candidatus Omnitrophota bacterium]